MKDYYPYASFTKCAASSVQGGSALYFERLVILDPVAASGATVGAGHVEGYVECRYADFPLPLGEAIMMNHALFTGLLHAGRPRSPTIRFIARSSLTSCSA